MRRHDMNGPCSITITDIRDGAVLFGWSLAPIEVETLFQMDRAFLSPRPMMEEDEEDDV